MKILMEVIFGAAAVYLILVAIVMYNLPKPDPKNGTVEDDGQW